MFALFYSLYISMFSGSWTNVTYQQIFGYQGQVHLAVNALGKLLTNTFNDLGNYESFGTDIVTYVPALTAFILALITSIGIVVVAVKGIKKAFGIFFMGINRL